jgi:hypothetical protein
MEDIDLRDWAPSEAYLRSIPDPDWISEAPPNLGPLPIDHVAAPSPAFQLETQRLTFDDATPATWQDYSENRQQMKRSPVLIFVALAVALAVGATTYLLLI